MLQTTNGDIVRMKCAADQPERWKTKRFCGFPSGVRQPIRFVATISSTTASSTSKSEKRLAMTVNGMMMKSVTSFVTADASAPLSAMSASANARVVSNRETTAATIRSR